MFDSSEKSLPLPKLDFGARIEPVNRKVLAVGTVLWGVLFVLSVVEASHPVSFPAWIFVVAAIILTLAYLVFVVVLVERRHTRYENARRVGRDSYVLEVFGPWFERKYALTFNQWEKRKLYLGVRVEGITSSGHVVSVRALDFANVTSVANGSSYQPAARSPWLQHFVSKREYGEPGTLPKK